MVARPPSELIAIQRDIETTRTEIASAVADLEAAAKNLVTGAQVRRAAARVYARRPELWLGAAFLLGWWVGAKYFRPRPVLVALE